MSATPPVKGPASYFPSIEARYGRPIADWLAVLDAVRDRPHMQQVAVLKEQHGMGHGHANALVAYHRAQAASDPKAESGASKEG